MARSELSPYLIRLKALQNLDLLPDDDKNKFIPKIVFMDTPQGVSEVGDAIASGWPVVTDYGATYGTAFPLEIREAIATARAESKPLATVSVVTFRDVAYSWMDTSRIHPDIVSSINEGKFDILTGISFIRFSGNILCQQSLSKHYINDNQEVQVFIVPDNDPLMSYLRHDHNIAYIAVRSSNITGQQEQAFAQGALTYTQAIGAPILAVRSLKSFKSQIEDELHAKAGTFSRLRRKRFGSQPILRFSNNDEPAILTLIRAGNTDPSTLQKLLSDIVSDKIGFIYIPEKPTAFDRPMFHTPKSINNPQLIRKLLLKHSGL